MNRTMNEKEELVKKSLFSFVRKQVPTAQLNLIDDIVLGYVVSMVEESAIEEELDVDGVSEMVSACLPEFSSIEKEAVTKWLFDIESQLRADCKESNGTTQQVDPLDCINLAALLPQEPQRTARVHHLSETSDAGSDSSGEYFAEESSWDQEVALLQEMFPEASAAEARHCLAVANGDIAQAAQLVLCRQEAGQSIVSNCALLTPNGRKAKVNDEELKARIINRYSYVDRDDDSREHRPVAPKTEPKKMVRYLDNKIVSVKGERFTEVKRGGEEEDGNEAGRKPRGHCHRP
ncbi:hypothetical protein TKK_0015176 [Trichogramma kaykai]|uniref:CUE domain-containing protein n=1 Tax=Trichogramma kaykai TaxID=54128 RepID=A0ABD2WAM1_9HYME